jgi:peroxiredoxin
MVMLIGSAIAQAVEVGGPAPDFTLLSTTGKEISLSQFKGKKNVLIEFYSFDFNPI